MTFDFSQIASVLVAQYDAYQDAAFSQPKRIVYYAPPDSKGLQLSECPGVASSALNEVTLFSDSSEFIQVLIGPRGQTLYQLQQYLGVVVTVRNQDGRSAIRVYGGHYACYAARLVIEDMMSSTKRYKEVQLAQIGRERTKITSAGVSARDGRLEHGESANSAGQQRSYLERTSARSVKEKDHQAIQDERAALPMPKSSPLVVEPQTYGQPRFFPAEDSATSPRSGELSWSQDVKPPGSEYL